jgi:gas vesicle protein
MNEYGHYGDYSEQKQGDSKGTGVGTALTFLLVGMGIGAAVALLFTPMSGRELRGSIGRGFHSALDGISQQTQKLRERGSNLLGFNRGQGNKQENQSRLG